MALTTLDNFINIYCVEDGMLANADNVNKSPIQLKKEIDEVYTNLTSTKNSKQVLDATDAIQVNGKVLSLKKGDASIESVSLDLFDTKVDKIVSVDNRVPRFNGTSGNIKLSSVVIDDNGNLVVPGSITSNTGVLTGNAASATKLQTARLIGGVSFDGTANITLPGVNSIGNQNTSGNAASATKLQTARLIGGVSFDGTANIDLPGVNIAGNQNTSGNAASATKLQTARLIGGVSFDGTANITLPGVNTAGNQNTSGNAASATKLQTPRSINLSGVSATAQNFDGTSNIVIPITSIPGSLLTGNAQLSGVGNDYNSAGLMLNGNGTANTVYPTLGFHQSGLYAGSIQLRSGGNFSFYQQGGTALGTINAGTVNAELTGNAATATKLKSARLIGGFLFDGSANIDLPGVNIAGNQNTSGNAASATKLQTPRSITLSGVLSGSANFDGSSNITIAASHTADPTITLSGGVTGSGVMYDLGNVTISTTVANDSHTHDTRYYTKNATDLSFLKLTGGALTGDLSTAGGLTVAGTVNANGGLAQDGHVILNGSDTWLRTKDSTGWYNATFNGGMYMSDNTWVRTYNSKGLLTDADLSVGGSITVGNGWNAASIIMYDIDEGTRYIHCNSNRIGFLTQSGDWGSFCNDDGSWETVGRLMGGIGGETTGSAEEQNWNHITNTRSGSGKCLLRAKHSYGPNNITNAEEYYHIFNFEYQSKNGSGNLTQMAVPYIASDAADSIYIRSKYEGKFGKWYRIGGSGGNILGRIQFNSGNGVITLRQGIISGVTINGSGWFTVNFSQAIFANNYTTAISYSAPGGQGGSVYLHEKLANSLVLTAYYGGDNTVGAYNPGLVDVTIFG